LAFTIGNTNDALKEFYEALRIDGNSAEPHFIPGSLLRQMGRRNEPIAHLAESRTTNKRNSNCMNSVVGDFSASKTA
jgi:hypothetical protein